MPISGDQLRGLVALRPAPKARPASRALPEESDRLGQLVGAMRQRNRYGEHLLVRRWYTQPEACAATPQAVRRLAPSATEETANPEQWLFLDIETTGLAGGTGTYAFLVGVGWWDAGGLQVEQFFMRDHSEEHSLLVALAERLAERRVLVTFNGKSFDWPLLETRYRMTRQIRLPEPRAHLDLLHPARQVWRLRLPSVRLTELEQHVVARNAMRLAWDRRDDVPSRQIPQIYFDYLRGGSAEEVAAVFRHNQMDLRGLAALSGKLLALLEMPEAAAGDALELYGLSKLLQRRGEHAPARMLYERALGAGLSGAVSRAARRALAALAKRDRDYARAIQLWEELSAQRVAPTPRAGAPEAGARRPGLRPVRRDEGPALRPARRDEVWLAQATRRVATTSDAGDGFADRLQACEELAIYYEHHARQPERAAEMARAALAELRRGLCAGLIPTARYARLKARLDRRLSRLTRKNGSALFKIACAIPRSGVRHSGLE